MHKLFVCLLMFAVLHGASQSLPPTKFEQTQGRQTPTYQEAVEWWRKADAASPYIQMKEAGPSDAGYPLHLVLVSSDKDFSITSIKKKKKSIILVNNGIHPGEPDGIDASMLLLKNILAGGGKLPTNVVLAIIPVYNIGGALNRSEYYRVDQNGPEEFGFRGNSQNLDLNRDFIKCDSKEATSFQKIFQELDPDVFIDNHVSNGADYQHVMTLLTTQHNKLGGELGTYINKTFEPALYAAMKTKNWDLVPYVNHSGETPDKGWAEYWDSPRYSSGYAAQWQCFGFVPETHMLKPYDQRVNATRDLMQCFVEFVAAHSGEIWQIREKARAALAYQSSFPLAWKWDRSKSVSIAFKGFEAGHRPSLISGQDRLYYDRARPFTKDVPFYNNYIDTLSITKPRAYVIPQGWWKVIERLQTNKVKMTRLGRDTLMEVEWYNIESTTASPRAYEGHHLNTNTKVSTTKSKVSFRKGDYLIQMNQAANRFLMETLEPQAEDSYFSWNFFDPILGQKEGYSDYVFEETAASYLKANPDIQIRLNARKASDSSFAKNGRAQLNFVYQNSPYFEPAYMRYPVYRVL